MSHQNMRCLKVSKSYIFLFSYLPMKFQPPPQNRKKKTPEKWRLVSQPSKIQQALGAKSFLQSDSGLQREKNGMTGQAIFFPRYENRETSGFLWGLLMGSVWFNRALLRETQWFFHKPWSWGRLPLEGYVRWRESRLRLVIKRNGFLFIDFSKWFGGGMDMWNRSHLLMVDYSIQKSI